VVPVTKDERLELLHHFRRAAKEPVFIHDEHAESVTCIEQCHGRRVVTCAICVAPHVFEPFDAELLQTVRECSAHSGMILVTADTLDLDRLAVEKEPAVFIETDCSYSHRC